MRNISKEELTEIIKMHALWLIGDLAGRRADLSSADLSSADLRFANLRFANLRSADLSSADLSSADLSSANLRFANLSSANLRFANLRFANLRFADLRSADLRSADLRSIKKSFLEILEKSHAEFVDLFHALQIGTVDGSQYEGECACLVGTIAKIRKENYRSLGIDLRPDSSNASERWFLAIGKGDTPQSNIVSKITCEWIEEFAKEKGVALPTYKIYSSFEIEKIRRGE